MQSTLAISSWTLYAIGVSLICSRIVFRRITLGCFKKAQADDWLMICLLLPYTASIVLANQIRGIQSPQDRKYRYALEEMQIITIWLVKACLLILYWRIFPTETQLWKRRTLQCLTALCFLSFLAVQISLLVSCRPNEITRMPITNTQCTTYRTHTTISLSLSTLTTTLILLLPIPFISTPRRLLQLLLLLLGTLVLITGILSRTSLLLHPASPGYLPWYTSESSLLVLFVNLPFLTSLVVASAPRRMRQFSATHSLSNVQWPRSRRASSEPWTPPPSRVGSMATTLGGFPGSPGEDKKMGVGMGGEELFGTYKTRYTERRGRCGSGSGSVRSMSSTTTSVMSVGEGMDGIMSVPAPPTAAVVAPVSPVRTSAAAKMRLSGGLAEMGGISVDNEEGWPVHWS